MTHLNLDLSYDSSVVCGPVSVKERPFIRQLVCQVMNKYVWWVYVLRDMKCKVIKQ